VLHSMRAHGLFETLPNPQGRKRLGKGFWALCKGHSPGGMPEFCDSSGVEWIFGDLDPGVSLRLTPGYYLASLQLAGTASGRRTRTGRLHWTSSPVLLTLLAHRHAASEKL
jgi:hypothetical protein